MPAAPALGAGCAFCDPRSITPCAVCGHRNDPPAAPTARPEPVDRATAPPPDDDEPPPDDENTPDEHPQAQPAPPARPPVTGTVDITDDTDTGDVLVRVTDAPRLHTRLGTTLGTAWDGVLATWRVTPTRRATLALRAALAADPAVVRISPHTAARLTAAAASAPPIDITVQPDGTVRVLTDWTKALQDDINRIDGYIIHGRGHWTVPGTQAHQALRVATRHDLTVSPELALAAAARDTPLDYDLTIEGLRGVPVTELAYVASRPAKGKTPSLQDRLAGVEIRSVFDLLMRVPLRYLDRSTSVTIRELRHHIGAEVGILAKITSVGQYDRMRRMTRFEISDGTGKETVTFFQMPWVSKRFRLNDEVSVWGRYEAIEKNGKTYTGFTNPTMDPLGDEYSAVVPIYPQSAKNAVTTWDLHGAAMEAVRRLGDLQDPYPDDLKTRLDLMDRATAYKQVHHPDTAARAEQARTRLAFDELIAMQLVLGIRRWAAADDQGVVHTPTGQMSDQVLAGLPYGLTGAQTRAMAEITADLARPHPMNRLLQGDVGSGKTVCAMIALCAALESGHQTAIMAPTEILASQLHYEMDERLTPLIKPDGTPLAVRYLASKTKMKERREILAGLADGTIDVVVGTHSLLSDEVEFQRLGLVVVDEQHRFGVEQRSALRTKGPLGPDGTRAVPDQFAMTATPIPRTAALTAFGDVSVSILNELPPGRTPIETTWTGRPPQLDGMFGEPWDRVRAELDAGRQAYVVASLVEDNERLAAESATAAYEQLKDGALAGKRLGLVHGKLKNDEKDATMRAFKNGELDVLVATTVIEVGVNVPNASAIIILDAGRFGIAQLHQLRGRVGRGRHPSFCVLTGEANSADGVARMKALVASGDGFVLSEIDLDLRGAGSIFGARQSGMTDLKVADLRRDKDLIVLARAEADLILDNDHGLKRRPALRSEILGALGDDAGDWLAKS